MMKSPNSIIEKIKKAPNFVSVAITDIESGISYESFSKTKHFIPELAAAYNLEIIKTKLKAIEAMNPSQSIKDIITTMSNETHIISVTPNKKHFLYLIMSNDNVNNTNLLLKEFKLLGNLNTDELKCKNLTYNNIENQESFIKNFFFSEFQ